MPSDYVLKIKELVEAHDLNMKAVSLAAGKGATFVRDMIVREREPSKENYEKVMDAIARIIGRIPLDPVREVSAGNLEPINRPTLIRDIDVVAAVAGSDPGRGSFRFSMDPIDKVARPPGLVGVKGVYSAYVENDSMWPMYSSGDLVYASTIRPPRPGDAVIIQNPGDVEGDEATGFIKILVRRTAEWIECKQFNPAGPVKFRNRPDLIMHRVFTNNELFGI